MRATIVLLALLPPMLLVPTAAADFPWDEAEDVVWGGEVTLRAGENLTLSYVRFAGNTANATYEGAADAARAALPATAPAVCAEGPTFACAAATVLDDAATRSLAQSTHVGREALRLSVLMLVDYSVRTWAVVLEAYGVATGAVIP